MAVSEIGEAWAARELGDFTKASRWRHTAQLLRCRELKLCAERLFKAAAGAITWLDLDKVEQRYLLAAGADASISLYDTQAEPGSEHMHAASAGQAASNSVSSRSPASAAAQHATTPRIMTQVGQLGQQLAHPRARQPGLAEIVPTFVIGRDASSGRSRNVAGIANGAGSSSAHQFFVSSIAWYPIDNGMFVTGSYDQSVCCWDTNTLEAVGRFQLQAKVSCVAMSSLAASHCLIAAAALEPHIMLCDPASGAFAHTLSGHKGPVWSVAWSNQSEHQLVSGDAQGQVRLWDIRRGGCLHVFDQYSTQRPPRRSCGSSSTSKSSKGAGGSGSSSSGSHPKGRASSGGLPPRGTPTMHRCRSSDGCAGSSRTQSAERTSTGGHGSVVGRVASEGLLAADVLSARQGACRGSSEMSTALMVEQPKRRRSLPCEPSTVAAGPSSLSDAAVRAHSGAVTGIVMLSDALHMLSAGRDARLRLWDMTHHHTLLVNYPGTLNSAMRGRQLGLNEDGSVVFFPTGSVIQVYETATGHELTQLAHGHYDSINCVCFNPLREELYSGGNDNQLVAWSIANLYDSPEYSAQDRSRHKRADDEEDRWDD